METTLEKDEKLGGKTHKKFLRKLNKEETERWRHLRNWFELFCLPKNSCEINFWWRRQEIAGEKRIEMRLLAE